ncbi:hypothetical protein EBR96_00725 [bacterium]|nr:hypothetical protein [bacterium]
MGVGGADLGITAVSMAIATRVAKWGYRYANRHEIKTIRRNAENASDKLKIKIKDLRDKLSQTVTPPQVLQLSSSDFNLIKVCKELKIFDYHGDTGQFNLWIGDKGTRGQADTEVRTEFLGPLRDALSRIGDSDIDKKIVG